MRDWYLLELASTPENLHCSLSNSADYLLIPRVVDDHIPSTMILQSTCAIMETYVAIYNNITGYLRLEALRRGRIISMMNNR